MCGTLFKLINIIEAPSLVHHQQSRCSLEASLPLMPYSQPEFQIHLTDRGFLVPSLLLQCLESLEFVRATEHARVIRVLGAVSPAVAPLLAALDGNYGAQQLAEALNALLLALLFADVEADLTALRIGIGLAATPPHVRGVLTHVRLT